MAPPNLLTVPFITTISNDQNGAQIITIVSMLPLNLHSAAYNISILFTKIGAQPVFALRMIAHQYILPYNESVGFTSLRIHFFRPTAHSMFASSFLLVCSLLNIYYR